MRVSRLSLLLRADDDVIVIFTVVIHSRKVLGCVRLLLQLNGIREIILSRHICLLLLSAKLVRMCLMLMML